MPIPIRRMLPPLLRTRPQLIWSIGSAAQNLQYAEMIEANEMECIAYELSNLKDRLTVL